MKMKGIRFNIVDEEAAKMFLSNNNYYMKLAAYRDNYEKIQEGERKGQYKNLEFAYLQELSTIDMYLRYLIIHMCLDIEHTLKVKLLSHIENNPLEDGYGIIKEFIDKNPTVCKKISKHKTSEYCKELITKYEEAFPAWVFVELISFSDLSYLCSFYNQKYNYCIVDRKLLNSVRDIRNASAHSNCLINKLRTGDTKPVHKIIKFVQNIDSIGSQSRQKRLSNKFIYDFTALLYVYDNIIESRGVKNHRYEELKNLIDNRMLRNQHFFKNNDLITSSYKFLKNVVDKIATV